MCVVLFLWVICGELIANKTEIIGYFILLYPNHLRPTDTTTSILEGRDNKGNQATPSVTDTSLPQGIYVMVL